MWGGERTTLLSKRQDGDVQRGASVQDCAPQHGLMHCFEMYVFVLGKINIFAKFERGAEILRNHSFELLPRNYVHARSKENGLPAVTHSLEHTIRGGCKADSNNSRTAEKTRRVDAGNSPPLRPSPGNVGEGLSLSRRMPAAMASGNSAESDKEPSTCLAGSVGPGSGEGGCGDVGWRDGSSGGGGFRQHRYAPPGRVAPAGDRRVPCILPCGLSISPLARWAEPLNPLVSQVAPGGERVATTARDTARVCRATGAATLSSHQHAEGERAEMGGEGAGLTGREWKDSNRDNPFVDGR